jgi:putative chitinase
MKITSVFYWLFITAIIMMACNKRDLVGKDEYKQFKDWLSINGLAYKEGKVTQIGADGKIQHLKLDWSNTSSYKIDGIDYTEVRFVNSNSGNDDLKSATNIFNSSESDDVSVSLVFRTRFGKIEGALKFEEEHANVKKDGKEVPGALEFFYDVNSNFINAWFYEKETKELKFLKNIVVNDISTMQAGSQNIVQGDPGCMVYSVKYTTPCPSVIGPPTPGTDLDEVAVCVHVGYRHFQVCSGGGASGGGNPGGGGTGGPGIGFIPSSQDTTWPSKKQAPPDPKKNPCPINFDQVKLAIPGNVTQQETLRKLIGLLDKWGPQFGFDNEYKVRHFMAQMAKETGGLNTLRKYENLNYRESALLEKWNNKFSTNPLEWNGAGCYNPKDFAHQPEKIANVIWGDINGNYLPGDGWKFRGRGVLQLNGRGNYTEFRDFYNKLFPANKLDFVEEPDLINSTDEIALLSGMWWCKRYLWKKIGKWDENTSVDQVSGVVNKFSKTAKAEGLPDRRKYFKDINQFVDCD